MLCESICYESIGQRAGGGRCKLPPSSTLPVLREAFLSCLTTGRWQMVEGPSWAAEWRNTRIHKKHTSCRMPTTPHTVQCLQRVGVGLVREGQATVPDKTVQTNYQNRNFSAPSEEQERNTGEKEIIEMAHAFKSGALKRGLQACVYASFFCCAG